MTTAPPCGAILWRRAMRCLRFWVVIAAQCKLGMIGTDDVAQSVMRRHCYFLRKKRSYYTWAKHKHSSQWTTASSCGSGPGRDRHKIILDPAWHFQARATFKEKHHIVSYTRVTPGPLLRNSQWNRSRALSPQRRIISVRSRHACVTIGSNWLLQTTKQSLDYNVTLNRSFACVKQM